mmetsp:Transcript_72747/g.161682  ORF Transcript_72747/g.161682 Transcript_72747/m.161682 type:complete len:214 (+) Transcript_72747:709-1350(+)
MSAPRVSRILARGAMPSRQAKSSGDQSPYECEERRRTSATGLPLPPFVSAHEFASSSVAMKTRSVSHRSLRGIASRIFVFVTPQKEPMAFVSDLRTLSTSQEAVSTPISGFSLRSTAMMLDFFMISATMYVSSLVRFIPRKSSVCTCRLIFSQAAMSNTRWWLLRDGLSDLKLPLRMGARSSTEKGSLMPSIITVFRSPRACDTAFEKFSSSL